MAGFWPRLAGDGSGFDQLILNLDQTIELVEFLDGRVVGFEEIVIASETAAELQIDMGLLSLVVPDDEALLIRADADQNLKFLSHFSAYLKNNKINGIGSIFPITTTGSASHHSQPKWVIAITIAYLPSHQGIIDVKNIQNHDGSPVNIFYAPTNFPKPCFTWISPSSISFSPLTKTMLGNIAFQSSKGVQSAFE